MGYEYGHVGWYAADVTLMIVCFATLLYLKHKLTPRVKVNKQPRIITFHTLQLNISDAIEVSIEGNSCKDLSGRVGCTFVDVESVDVLEQTEDKMRVKINGHIELIVKHRTFEDTDTTHIYSIEWMIPKESKLKDKFEDCFDLQDDHWYGLGHFFNHYWPLEKCHGNGAMVTAESGPFVNNYFGALQERVLFSSSGVGFALSKNEPLFIDINGSEDRVVKFKVSGRAPYEKRAPQSRTFSYEIFQSTNVKALWQAMQANVFKSPVDIPNETIFKYPIWSTWAEYKKDIDQDRVLKFANDIRANNFPYSFIEIDDDWTPHYGDLEFDSKFPDPKAMIQKLKEMDFKVSIWIHPYLSLLSKSFRKGWSKGYLVTTWLSMPAIYSWWDGYAGLIDFTNADATAWFLQKLKNLKTEFGVDTFKLDAGEGYQLAPPMNKTKRALKSPNEYTHLFVNVAAKCDTDLRAQEVRVGSNNQELPMFFRLQDKDSNWGYFNGLKTVIPHVLTQGLLGYPFVLPDMIGGNAYSIISGSSYPEKELYIRWMQLNALLPAMQISIPPWRYDKEVIALAQRMCALHEKFSPKIIALAREATKTGAPIIRPLWWIAPDDKIALTIDSEFLLGDEILVAPVLDFDARSRDIYLPKGRWRNENSGLVCDGGMWYYDCPAALNVLPYFQKV